jgi:hypothetical protein
MKRVRLKGGVNEGKRCSNLGKRITCTVRSLNFVSLISTSRRYRCQEKKKEKSHCHEKEYPHESSNSTYLEGKERTEIFISYLQQS